MRDESPFARHLSLLAVAGFVLIPLVTVAIGGFKTMGELRVNPFGDLPEPMPLQELTAKLTAEDGYTGTPNDQADVERQWPQLKALYMIDRDGIVRWVDIECQQEGLAGIGKLPSEEVILQAARAMAAPH